MNQRPDYEFTDRYEALGVPYPDPQTMCKGQCDGLGFYPQGLNDPGISDAERVLWQAAHDAPNAHEGDGGKCDGWHFIQCAECGGSGKRP